MPKSAKRQKYLSEIWQSYPEMPKDAIFAGRVTGLTDDILQIDGKNFERKDDESIATEELIDILLPGDIVSVTENGLLMLLSPCLNPLGIPMGLEKKDTLRDWSIFLSQIKSHFVDDGFAEIQTPSLVVNPGTEPTLDPFSTTFHVGTKIKQQLYLPTSPELHLKKSLAMGYRKIFEMKPCFRDGEVSQTHEPEFWMLEWYRAYSNLEQIKEDLKKLVSSFSRVPNLQFHSRSLSELFHEHLDFNLTPSTTASDLLHLCQKKDLPVDPSWSFDDLFHYLFVTVIEPQIDSDEPMFVYDYPPSQAALARLTKEGWGDRFELYWKGLEVCNAFHELNDPHEQRKRSEEDLAKKSKLGKATQPLDEGFFDALESGIPPSAGVALGLERFFMAIHGMTEIQMLKLFSYQQYLEE